MGRLYVQNSSGEKILKCKYCRVDSASHDDIISKDFQGRFGRPYLFKNVRRHMKKVRNIKMDCRFRRKSRC